MTARRRPDQPRSSDAWTLSYDGFDADDEGRWEALSTLGNGVFATRGADPEACADDVHYPGTYRAGLYDRRVNTIDGHSIDNESLVNLPNWLPLTIATPSQPWLGEDESGWTRVSQRREIDLRRGLLTRELHVRDGEGRSCIVTQQRFVHMDLPHVAGLKTTIVAHGWSGRLRVRSGLDGRVENTGVARYRSLDGHHLEPVSFGRIDDHTISLVVETSQSKIRIAQAARTCLNWNGQERIDAVSYTAGPQPSLQYEVDVAAGDRIVVEKVAAMFCSQDRPADDPERAAIEHLRHLGRFDELLERHELAWQQLWRRFRFDFGERDESLDTEFGDVPCTVRLHLFHILQTLSPHTARLDVGVPARGLHGEAYRGHVFWDELFVFPLLTLRLPSLARSLLMYRYRRLPAARRAAVETGCRGAMFPWQSGNAGREESQRVHLNPLSGRWLEDATYRQRHVGLAIAFNVWQYYEATDDRDFLATYGAEMILEVARFFASIATFDTERQRYVIRGVVGPDEFHTGYPGRESAGIDNNAYTNLMTVWVLNRALEILRDLPAHQRRELVDRLDLRPHESQLWDRIAHQMYVPFHDGILAQFDGYERLAELNLGEYESKYGDVQRIDRILEAEGDSVARYQVSKQADVLMLFYLLPAEELTALLRQLRYDLDPETIPRTIDYYLERTTHGSTLSAVVHAWVLARFHRSSAWKYFERTLASDIADIQGGTTAEGIHLAAMAGSVDLLQRCFTGLQLRNGALSLDPNWPRELSALEFDLHYRRHLLTVRIAGRGASIRSTDGAEPSIRLTCRGEAMLIKAGTSVQLDDPAEAPT